MTNQQYRALADRLENNPELWIGGDDNPHLWPDVQDAVDALRSIERPVPTTDEPTESLFGNIRVVTGRNLSVPSGATEGAIAVFPSPGIPEDLPTGTVFIELISGRHAKGLMSVQPSQPSQPSPHQPTREQIAEALFNDPALMKMLPDSGLRIVADRVLALIQNGAER